MNHKSSIKNLLYLSIPIFIANLALPLVAIVDTGLMGNLDNASYLTATSIATSLFSLIFWSFGFLRMGTVGIVSQAHGAGRYNEIIDLFFRNITFVILISLVLILLKNFIFNLSLEIFNLSNDTEQYFKNYFYIRIYSSLGELTIYVITGLFIGLQKTLTSSIVVTFFSITNIICSLFFVLYIDLNVVGVALGTLVASTLTAVIFIVHTFNELKKITSINFKFKQIYNIKKIQNIFNINFNIFIRTVLLTFSFLFFTYLGNRISENVVAANTILINLIFLSAFILDAYAISTEGIVGHSIGSKNIILLRQVIKNSFILSASTGLIISILYFFIKNHFISWMTDLPEIKTISLLYSYWVIIIPLISSFCYQFDGIFVGASQTKELRNAMIISVCVYILSATYLISNFANSGLWLSFAIFFIVRALTLLFYLNRVYEKILKY